MFTLLHPGTGKVKIKGVTSSKNSVLHPWLQASLSEILQASPLTDNQSHEKNRPQWERWQDGLKEKVSLPNALPPLRILLILDNLAGHKSCEFILWLFTNGIMPLYTPLGGSWLNMAESIQNILKGRALNGQHPKNSDEIINWLHDVAANWNQSPTPFEWGGKRFERRLRRRERRRNIKGSGACPQTALKTPVFLAQTTH